jgi:hypothetical protein
VSYSEQRIAIEYVPQFREVRNICSGSGIHFSKSK